MTKDKIKADKSKDFAIHKVLEYKLVRHQEKGPDGPFSEPRT